MTDKKTESLLSGVIYALSLTIDYKDPYTAGHQQRVASLACEICKELDYCKEELIGIRIAGQLHDIGKIGVSTDILSKPGKISDAEFLVIKDHAEIGYQILQPIPFPWPIAQITYQHHERMDGSGYPNGLIGNEILLEARIISVSDVVEAISSVRAYRTTLGLKTAIEEIKNHRGTLYDHDVVDACIAVFNRGFSFR